MSENLSALRKSKIALIGATRGLGRCLAEQTGAGDELCVIGRGSVRPSLKPSVANRCHLSQCDLSRLEDQLGLIDHLLEWKPERLFYLAGGGPYGLFQEKNWRDHEWCWQVTFVAAARVLHSLAGRCQQMVFVGSSIAEANPDPRAASYAAAKHALRGLIESVQKETPHLDVRLYSPGYMNTDLLPKNSTARHSASAVWEPQDVAEDLWSWSQDESQRGQNRTELEIATSGAIR